MHELRTWGVSALVAAGLLGLVCWRFLPLAAATWVLVALGWVLLSALVHLLLHNRWMHALEDHLHARRERPAGAGARGPAHASRRPSPVVRPLSRVHRERVNVSAPLPPPPAPPVRTALPPLRPVGSRGAAGTRYHRAGSASGRVRTGRAAHR